MRIDGQAVWRVGRLEGWKSGRLVRLHQPSNFPIFQPSRNSTFKHMLLLILISLVTAGCGSYEFNGTEYVDAQPATDFELTATDGERFRLSDHQGQIVLMFFGYTSCPDVCPTTLAEARRILDDLGEDADQVRFLFITVDPERDTSDVLATYTTAFHPDIVGLTGDPQDLEEVRQAYGVFAEKEVLDESATGYIVNHTARIFLVDAKGQLRLSYRFGTSPDDILQDVRHLLG